MNLLKNQNKINYIKNVSLKNKFLSNCNYYYNLLRHLIDKNSKIEKEEDNNK